MIDTDDRLLATTRVMDLMVYIGFGDPDKVEPAVRRMLGSEYAQVREAGGWMAALAGLDLGPGELLTTARESQDVRIRTGAARLCARRLPHTSDTATAIAALRQFVNDEEEVRQAAAEVAGALREQALRPYAEVLEALIDSPAFSIALAQLLITLQMAPDRIDALVLRCTQRFLDVHGTDAGNLSTAAAGEAPEIGQLVLRAYAQATAPEARAETLDLIDGLLLSGAYNFDHLVAEAER